MEKSRIAGGGRDQRGKNVGAAQDEEPHQIAVAEQARESDAGERQVDRRADILYGLGLVGELDERQAGADQPDGEQHDERNELAVEGDAGADAHGEQRQHQKVVRRGLDERDRAGDDRDEQHNIEELLRRGPGAGPIVAGGKRGSRISRGAQ